MNAAQQQIMAEWHQGMQQGGAEYQALMQRAAGGCQSLVAQHPTDIEPLARALRAVEVQLRELKFKAADPIPEIYDRLRGADPDGSHADVAHALAHVKRASRAFMRWADEQWSRFECYWATEQLRAMWPHVQEVMAQPSPCQRCGSPMSRSNPRQSESITCPACRAVNQVAPHPMVDAYFRSSYFFDEPSVIDKLMAVRKFEDDWEDVRDAEFAAGRDRPEAPLERLEQLERLTRDHWTAHFQSRVRNQGGSAEDVERFVAERMQLVFYPNMNHNAAWRAAHGAPSPASNAAPTINDEGAALLEPIEGVSVELYGQLEAKRTSTNPAEFVQHLAQHQMDQPKFDRIAKAWCDRMAHDKSNAIYAEYQKGLFSQAVSADSVSFEKFCEIQGAWNAWGKQGKDPSAQLQQHFTLSATDFSNIAMSWMQKMTATPSMFADFSRLTAEAEQKYLALP